MDMGLKEWNWGYSFCVVWCSVFFKKKRRRE